MKKLIIASVLAITIISITNILIYEYNFWLKQPDNTIQYPNIKKTYKYQPIQTGYRDITMFNAGDPNQTDSTPCISANGENICTALALGYNRCASNEFDFGTRLEIRGLGECIVVDRMNSRYKTEVDWALTAEQKQKAIDFGRQNILVIIK